MLVFPKYAGLISRRIFPRVTAGLIYKQLRDFSCDCHQKIMVSCPWKDRIAHRHLCLFGNVISCGYALRCYQMVLLSVNKRPFYSLGQHVLPVLPRVSEVLPSGVTQLQFPSYYYIDTNIVYPILGHRYEVASYRFSWYSIGYSCSDLTGCFT